MAARLLALIPAPLRPVILFGLLIRFLLMPFAAFSQDVGNIHYTAHLFATGHWNVYQYLGTHGEGSVWDTWGYFPLGFIVLGTFHFLLTPFMGGFEGPGPVWLAHDHLFRFLFLVKLPYLFFDALTGWIIYVLLRHDPSAARAGFALWWLNPISLFVSYVFGQLDILPTAAAVGGVVAAVRGRALAGGILHGAGALLKSYPLLLLPLLAFSRGERPWRRVALAGGIVTLAAGLLPFLSDPTFRGQILFAPTNLSLFNLSFGPDGAHSRTIVFIAAYTAFFLWYAFGGGSARISLVHASFLLLAGLFFSIDFHPQWFLWIVPFLVLVAAEKRQAFLLKYAALAFFAVTLSWKFEWVYWIPAAPEFFARPQPLVVYLEKLGGGERFVNLARSALSGILLYLAYLVVTNRTPLGRPTVLPSPSWFKAGSLAAPILCLLIVFIPVRVPWSGVSQDHSDQDIALTKRGVQQSFVSRTGTIDKVWLNPSPLREGPSRSVSVAILDDAGRELSVASSEIAPVSDPYLWSTVRIPAISVPAGTRLILSVSSDAPDLRLRANSSDAYADGRLTVNGTAQPGDLAFRVRGHDPLRIVDELWPRLKRDPAFLVFYLAILGGTVGLGVLVGGREKGRDGQP